MKGLRRTLVLLAILTPLALISPWLLSAVLIGACGVCVAFEFALVKVPLHVLEREVANGIKGAEALLAMKHDMNAMLAACQFGITLTSLGLTLALEPAIHHALMSWDAINHWEALAGASTALAMTFGAFLHVTFGELIPKGLALVVPKKVLYATGAFMTLFRLAAVPFIKSCNAIANRVVTTLTGKNPDTDAHHGESVEIDEALLMAYTQGRIAVRQLQLMKNVLHFADRTAREVMTPARLVITLDTHRPWEENFATAEEHGFSRFPVIAGSAYDVVGYVRRAELLKSELAGKRDLAALLHTIERRPETARLTRLNLFRGAPLVACYDEHDSFSGLLTAEDVIEQIIGEIYDETDDVMAVRVEHRPDGTIRMDGALLLEDAGDVLGLDNLDLHRDVDTIGGLVLKELARQPKRGDKVALGAWTAVVESAQGFRILSLNMLPRNTAPETNPANTSE
jgi:CBS domain containing-hemolysin-like protein